METKVCTKCKEIKTIDLFYKRSASKDGLTAICKFCSKKNQKIHRNLDKSKKSLKKYQQSDKFKESLKKYRESNKGKENSRASIKKYMESGKRKAYLKKYKELGKSQASEKKYRESNKGKEIKKKYRESGEGKEVLKNALEKYMKSDAYFKVKLKLKGFKTKYITQDLIDQQRQIIETNRLITKINKYDTSK